MIIDRSISSNEALANGKRVILEALPPRWKLYAVSLVCMVGAAFFTGALANSTKAIVNEVFVDGAPDAAHRVALMVIGIAAAKSIFVYLNSVLTVSLNRSISFQYQRRLFKHVLKQDVTFFGGEHPPRQMALLQQFGRGAGQVVSRACYTFVVEVLTLISLVTVMVMQDPIMSLLCLVILPLIFWLVKSLSKRIRAASNLELQLAGNYYKVGAETLEGIKTVKSFQLEDISIKNFNSTVDEMEERVLQVARISAATIPLLELLGGIVIGLFVAYGAWQTTTGSITPGEITAFITAFLLAYQPAERVAKVWVDLQKAMVNVTRMYEILDREPVELSYGSTELPEDRTPDIRFEDVSFTYGGNSPALTGVAFEIPAGQRIAVVGRSGAGKSTLIDILQRFYDPQEGAVKLDGHDLRKISQDSLHKAIAFVSQDIFLFEGTIADNIADGDPDATREEIEEAARCAQLGPVLAGLPAGLDAHVGLNGSALSGGQRQRLGIARGLVKKAKIYIFDEVTSALDAQNEYDIMVSLKDALRDATVLFVTHRPSTLAHVDRVLFLEGGRVVGFDRPQRLARENPAFRAMFPGILEDLGLRDAS